MSEGDYRRSGLAAQVYTETIRVLLEEDEQLREQQRRR